MLQNSIRSTKNLRIHPEFRLGGILENHLKTIAIRKISYQEISIIDLEFQAHDPERDFIENILVFWMTDVGRLRGLLLMGNTRPECFLRGLKFSDKK